MKRNLLLLLALILSYTVNDQIDFGAGFGNVAKTLVEDASYYRLRYILSAT